MAKECFYCGRELTTGERCHCKNPQTPGENAAAEAAKGKKSAGPSGKASNDSVKDKAARSRTESKSKNSGAKPSDATGRFRKMRFSRFFTFKDQVRTMFPTFSHAFASGAQYFMRPASKIRQESLRSKRSFSIVYILCFSLHTGLLGILLTRSGSALFMYILAVIMGQDLYLVYSYPGYAFLAITVLTFLLFFAQSGAFYIAARFSNRKPTFRKTVDLISLSLVYPFAMGMFLLITILLGGRGSLLLLLIGLLLMGITNFLSFRNALGLSEDAVFFFLLFVYFLCYIFISLLLFATTRLLGLV